MLHRDTKNGTKFSFAHTTHKCATHIFIKYLLKNITRSSITWHTKMEGNNGWGIFKSLLVNSTWELMPSPSRWKIVKSKQDWWDSRAIKSDTNCEGLHTCAWILLQWNIHSYDKTWFKLELFFSILTHDMHMI